jgi:hypothetical protein
MFQQWVVVAWAVCVVSGVCAELVTVFRNEGVSCEELEAVAEGPPSPVGKEALDERGWCGCGGERVGYGCVVGLWWVFE